MELYVLVYDDDGVMKPWRGNEIPKHNQSLRRNIRTFTTEKQAEACKRVNSAPDYVRIQKFVPEDWEVAVC